MLTTTTTKSGDEYRSIQRPRVYRALRRRGFTKTEAARISNAQAPGHTVKADDATTVKEPNYHAKRGETIAGNLKRGDDGKFASGGGSASPHPPAHRIKPKKLRAHKPKKLRATKPKKAPAVKLTPEQRTQQRLAARQAERETNRETAVDGLAKSDTMNPGSARALLKFADGKGEDPAFTDGLVKAGMMERGEDGKPRLSATGRAAVSALNRGDAQGAADRLSKGQSTVAAQRKRANERAARIAERERKRQEREAKKKEPKPKGGGGGGKKKGDNKDAQAQAKLDQSIANLQRLSGKAADPVSSFVVFKDTNGAYRWLAQTTTAFEDRDKEVISLKSLEADAARMDADAQYGPLRWWHVGSPNALDPIAPWGPGLDLGWCDFNAVSGKTLIESGTFKTEAIARWAAANADALGLSPGFFHPATEPDHSGVFHHIRRFERSLAPKERVSNLFTAFSVTRNHTHKEYTPVDPEKISQLLDMGFDQATLKALLANVTQTEKTAEASGVRFKEVAPPVANPVLDQLSALETQIAALKASMVPAPVEDEEKAVDNADTQMQAADDTAVSEDVDEDAAEDAAFMDAIGAMLDTKLAPLMAALDIHGKVEKMVSGLQGELKAMAGGAATATKTAQANQTELATLKARIAELEGGQTNLQRGHIASQDLSTVTKTAAELAVGSQPQPLSPIEQDIKWANDVAQWSAGFGSPPA